MQNYNQDFNKYAGGTASTVIGWLPRFTSWGKTIAKYIPFIGKRFRKGEQTMFDIAKAIDRKETAKKVFKTLGGAAVTGATGADLYYNVKNQEDKNTVETATKVLDENQKLKQYVIQNAMNSAAPTGIPEVDAAKAQELANKFEIGKLFDISSPYAQYYTLPTAAGAALGGLIYGGKGSAIGGASGLGLGLLAKYIADSQGKSTANTSTASA